MGIYRKSDGVEVAPSDLVDWKNGDSEEALLIVSNFIETMHLKGIISDQDVIDLVPSAWRWFEAKERNDE